ALTSISSLISRNNRCCPCFPSSFSTSLSPVIFTLTLAIAGAFVVGARGQGYPSPQNIKINLVYLEVPAPPVQSVIYPYHYVRSVTDLKLEYLANVVLRGDFVYPPAAHSHPRVGIQYRDPSHRS